MFDVDIYYSSIRLLLHQTGSVRFRSRHLSVLCDLWQLMWFSTTVKAHSDSWWFHDYLMQTKIIIFGLQALLMWITELLQVIVMFDAWTVPIKHKYLLIPTVYNCVALELSSAIESIPLLSLSTKRPYLHGTLRDH